MPRTRIASFAALAVLVLVMAGCSKQDPPFTADDQIPEELVEPSEGEGGEGEGEGAEGEGSGETVRFVAAGLKFTEGPATVPAGDVVFELVNEDGLPHDVTVEELGDETVVKAGGKETATGQVELDPGTYNYFCSVPGHSSTMKGTFTVA